MISLRVVFPSHLPQPVLAICTNPFMGVMISYIHISDSHYIMQQVFGSWVSNGQGCPKWNSQKFVASSIWFWRCITWCQLTPLLVEKQQISVLWGTWDLDYNIELLHLMNKFDHHRTRNIKLVLLSTFFRDPENAKHAPSLPLQYTQSLEFAALLGMCCYDFKTLTIWFMCH